MKSKSGFELWGTLSPSPASLALRVSLALRGTQAFSLLPPAAVPLAPLGLSRSSISLALTLVKSWRQGLRPILAANTPSAPVLLRKMTIGFVADSGRVHSSCARVIPGNDYLIRNRFTALSAE